MIGRFAFRLASKIGQLAAAPGDSEDERLQKSLLLGACFAFVPLVIPWILAHLAFSEPFAASVSTAYLLLSGISVLAFLRTGRFSLLLRAQQVLVLTMPFLFMLSLGGFAESSAVILWAVICPVGTLIIAKPEEGPRWMVAYLMLLALGGVLQPYFRAMNNVPPGMVIAFFVLNIGVVSMILFTLLFYFVREKDKAYRLLHIEQQKSERLLLNVLPEEIAPKLKDMRGTIADRFEATSVLFADVVDFTPLSADLEPEEMVELLNEIFSYFDQLVDAYGLEKIRTIGDNYLVASGVPVPRPDHAAALAGMALDMLDYLDQRILSSPRPLAFRIGINSGPLIAGVIGRTKFHYDIWGDTVNTASRMESHGVAGKIQVTPQTYELIRDLFVCEPRGSVQIKGIGAMDTWFLTARRSSVAAQPHAQ